MPIPAGGVYDFGHIEYIGEARETLFRKTLEALDQTSTLKEKLDAQKDQLSRKHSESLQEKGAEIDALKKQVEKLKEENARLEKEKEQLQKGIEEEKERSQKRAAYQDEVIAYLNRKLQYPGTHIEVADWARKQYPDTLVMHSRTDTLLAKSGAGNVNLTLLCDALDFLATDYTAYFFHEITKDEMNDRCSRKYGRPFDVRSVGDMTIAFTPSDYKVKYRMTGTEKAKEYGLDRHLCVGNDPENLLRIYFFADEAGKKLVIGSLPEHLRAVQIR